MLPFQRPLPQNREEVVKEERLQVDERLDDGDEEMQPDQLTHLVIQMLVQTCGELDVAAILMLRFPSAETHEASHQSKADKTGSPTFVDAINTVGSVVNRISSIRTAK
jgi:hypothetical protein